MIHGEHLFEIDFSILDRPGTYFIRVPGIGRSWPFRHAKDAYGEAFYVATRGLFHQRASRKLEPPATQWLRERAHTEPIYESDWIPWGPGYKRPRGWDTFDVIGATFDRDRKTERVDGGWYDAADWDRNLAHYACILDLLHAYEIAPEKFSDGQLGIPESGNGIPDILDEAEYGLRIWAHSMNRQGGVTGSVETWSHPSMTDPRFDYAFGLRTRWASLIFAGAAAQLSQHVQEFFPAMGDRYADLAAAAYGFGIDPKNSLGEITVQARKERGKGKAYEATWTEPEEPLQAYLAYAKARLFLMTKDPAYAKGIDDHLKNPIVPGTYPYGLTDYSTWFLWPFAKYGSEIPGLSAPESYKRILVNKAIELANLTEQMPYRHSWPKNLGTYFAWGNSDMTNHARLLLMAYDLSEFEPLRDSALLNIDHMLGANAMGMSWTTGIGLHYPVVLQHEVSEVDGIADPVPGITLYGITGTPIHYYIRQNVWASPKGFESKEFHPFYEAPEIPLYRRWSAHPRLNPPQCEFTIHETMSSTAFACALLIPVGWMPNKEITGRAPRAPRHLFGYYYTP